MSLTSAAKSGNRRETLVALRDSLALAIDNCESGRDIAALSKRLMEVMAEIESLPKDKKENPLAKARQKRGASA